MIGEQNVIFANITVTGNSKSALCIANSKANFTGATKITNNTGQFGGGINSKDSVLLFTGYIEIRHNQALLGGGIYSLYGGVNFQNMLLGMTVDTAQFAHNIAYRDGGAIHATSSYITLKSLVHFAFNSAQNGGVVYLKTAGRLTLERSLGAMFRTSHNQATEFGGVKIQQHSFNVDMSLT